MLPHPWMQFYTRDWLDNKELRRCSPAARAVLLDLMCLAHEGVPYGHLADKIGPLTEDYMASRCVISTSKLRSFLSELKANERLSATDQGVLFIQRMIEDAAVHVDKVKAGSSSKGNPKLSTLYNEPGFLYLLRRESDGATKIGIAVDVQNRIYKLRTACRPDTIDIIEVFEVGDMGTVEATLHGKFEGKRVGGDWFALIPSDIGEIRSSIKGSSESSFPRAQRASVSVSVSNSLSSKEKKEENPEYTLPFEDSHAETSPDHPRVVRPAVQAATPEAAGASIQDRWFAEWWAIYWLHKSKAGAKKAFRFKVRTMLLFQRVMEATREQTPEMMSREPSKRPYGATWLNGERWEDEAAVVPVNGRPATGHKPTFIENVQNEIGRNLVEKGKPW
jgi:hypothetical protein